MKKILFVFGTRPEAIKLYPLIKLLKKNNNLFTIKICISSQHKGLLKQVLRQLKIKVDYDLNVMTSNQKIEGLYGLIFNKLSKIIDREKPNLSIIQGDTITAMSAAMISKLKKVKVGHVEAGLRTFDYNSPWPEEFSRTVISNIADLNFCPTKINIKKKKKENIKNIFLTGNTIVDSVKEIVKKNLSSNSKFENFLKKNYDSKINVFLTVHRRESFGKPIMNIFKAIKEISKIKGVKIIYPIHPNPNIKKYAKILNKVKNIKIIKPLNYIETLKVLKQTDIIMSDSGGIQEESSILNKKILILRNKTERPEILGKNGILVGHNKKKIIYSFKKFLKLNLKRDNQYIFGNGRASQRIVGIIKKHI